MSGELHEPVTALMTPEQAGQLLDDIIYSRVLECVDLRRLLMIELDLWAALSEQASASEPRARCDAIVTINRALERLAADGERYAAIMPFGAHCTDCVDEMAEQPSRKRRKG